MRRSFRVLACAACLFAAWLIPAVAQAANGQLAAVVDGRLVAFNADGSGLRMLPVPDAGQITELAFSPGGNRLAFVKAGGIGVLELTTGRVLSVTAGATDANPAWATDGTAIAFRRGVLTYRVAPATGATPEPYLVDLLAGTTDIAWAPGLKAFAPGRGGAVAAAGREPRAAARGHGRPGVGAGQHRGRVRPRRRPVVDLDRGRCRQVRDRRPRGRAAVGAGLELARVCRRKRGAHRRCCGRGAADGRDGRGAGRPRRLAAVRGRRDGELRVRRRAALQRDRRHRHDPIRPAGRPPAPAVHRPRGAPARPDHRQGPGARHAGGPALHPGRRLFRTGLGRLPRQQRRLRVRDLSRDDLRRAAPRAACRGGDTPGRRAAPGTRPGRAVPQRARDAATGPQAHRARQARLRPGLLARRASRPPGCAPSGRSRARRSSARSPPHAC